MGDDSANAQPVIQASSRSAANNMLRDVMDRVCSVPGVTQQGAVLARCCVAWAVDDDNGSLLLFARVGRMPGRNAWGVFLFGPTAAAVSNSGPT